jgi:hypothetical protein
MYVGFCHIHHSAYLENLPKVPLEIKRLFMPRFLDKFAPKSAEELESLLSRLKGEFSVERFDSLVGEVYGSLSKAIEQADVSHDLAKVKKLSTVEKAKQRLEFLKALKTLKPHWKGSKEA